MERDFGAEIDAIKEELRSIRRFLLWTQLPKVDAAGEGGDVLSAEGREQLDGLLKQLMAFREARSTSGAIAYTGTFQSGDGDSTRQSMWTRAVNTDDLLRLNDNHLVEKVLSSVGNSQRLAILLALLKKPMTVNQLVEALGANTTGQIYHHLKPLAAVDIIKEEKGVYVVVPHRVQGIVMLLAGISDLTDNRYTSGQWEG